MKKLFDMYNEVSQRVEDFMFEHILPVIFRVLLFGMKLTLLWAVYLLITEIL
jgi:hypothetical protein